MSVRLWCYVCPKRNPLSNFLSSPPLAPSSCLSLQNHCTRPPQPVLPPDLKTPCSTETNISKTCSVACLQCSGWKPAPCTCQERALPLTWISRPTHGSYAPEICAPWPMSSATQTYKGKSSHGVDGHSFHPSPITEPLSIQAQVKHHPAINAEDKLIQ